MNRKIKIIKRPGRRLIVIRFWDEETGRWVERTSGTGVRRDAARIADSVIDQFMSERQLLQEQEARAADEIAGVLPTNSVDDGDLLDWDHCRAKYERDKLPHLKSPGTFKSAANLFETICKPRRLLVSQPEPPKRPRNGDVSNAMLSTFVATLLKKDSGVKKATITSYVKHIRAFLGWAKKDIQVIKDVPTVHVSRKERKNAIKMKGRPLREEELERVLGKFVDIVGPEQAREWERGGKIMRHAGLRLEELIELTWDDTDAIHIARLDTRRPVIIFPEDTHKAIEYAEVPLTPAAVALLRKTPLEQRSGKVVNLRGRQRCYRTANGAGRVFSEAGRQAGVVVEKNARRARKANEELGIKVGDWLPKYASAHDFRRSYGDALSYLVMPTVLMKLMRHASIETTMKYYVGRNTEQLANEVWDAFAAQDARTQVIQNAENSMSAQGAGLGAIDPPKW